jgi:hypothetical protein
MVSRRRLLLGGILLLATLSYGTVAAQKAAYQDLSNFDPGQCASGDLVVKQEDDEVEASETVRAYENLSGPVQDSFDRALRRDNDTTAIDPARVADAPEYVRYNGTQYELFYNIENCPTIPGTPRALDVVVDPLLFVWDVFFQGPLGVVTALLVAALVWREIDAWLQY